MKVTMATQNLKTIFDASKNFVCEDPSHPALQGVWLDFHCEKCTAYAADFIKMIQITVPYVDGDEGAMLVPIIKLPKDPFVTLSDEGNEITFAFFSGKQTLKKYDGEYLQTPERFFPTAPPEFTIGFDSKNLKDALSGFGNGAVRLDFFGLFTPCIITGDDRRALVFPVKLKTNN